MEMPEWEGQLEEQPGGLGVAMFWASALSVAKTTSQGGAKELLRVSHMIFTIVLAGFFRFLSFAGCYTGIFHRAVYRG